MANPQLLYITNKDKLKSILSISSIWAIKMGSLQNTVTWYKTHLAGLQMMQQHLKS